MTFLDNIKNELIENAPKKPCCRRSMLLGMLASRGYVTEDGFTELRIAHKETAALALRLVKEQFGRQAENIPAKHGGRYHTLRFQSTSAKKFLEDLKSNFLASPFHKSCPSCSASFLKGVFLTVGHMTDPQKRYHLEFSLGDRAEDFVPFLDAQFGFAFKVAKRKNESLLYFKDSAAIEDMLTLLGINDAAFLLMNCKIEKQFRNEANRRTNCEAGNITRTVNAAAKVLTVLRTLESGGFLSSLPEELADIARLRLLYPEASLTQLAALTTPPLTKSGVNHRLQKILDLAKKTEIDQIAEL